MKLPRHTVFAVASLLALTACATAPTLNPTARRLADAANTLEEDARALASRSDAVNPTFASEAHEFQQRAYELRTAADSGHASNGELRADFEQVTRSYEALRSDAQRLATPQASGAIDLVSGAYQNVATELGNPPSMSVSGS
jgi:hypothetical protein